MAKPFQTRDLERILKTQDDQEVGTAITGWMLSSEDTSKRQNRLLQIGSAWFSVHDQTDVPLIFTLRDRIFPFIGPFRTVGTYLFDSLDRVQSAGLGWNWWLKGDLADRPPR